MIYIIIGLVLVVVGAFGVVINMLKKNEKLEQLVIDQQVYIDQFSQAIEYADIKLKELDSKNTFKGDDEIGWFFKNILYIQELLNSFKLNIYNEKSNKTQPNNTPITGHQYTERNNNVPPIYNSGPKNY